MFWVCLFLNIPYSHSGEQDQFPHTLTVFCQPHPLLLSLFFLTHLPERGSRFLQIFPPQREPILSSQASAVSDSLPRRYPHLEKALPLVLFPVVMMLSLGRGWGRVEKAAVRGLLYPCDSRPASAPRPHHPDWCAAPPTPRPPHSSPPSISSPSFFTLPEAVVSYQRAGGERTPPFIYPALGFVFCFFFLIFIYGCVGSSFLCEGFL